MWLNMTDAWKRTWITNSDFVSSQHRKENVSFHWRTHGKEDDNQRLNPGTSVVRWVRGEMEKQIDIKCQEIRKVYNATRPRGKHLRKEDTVNTVKCLAKVAQSLRGDTAKWRKDVFQTWSWNNCISMCKQQTTTTTIKPKQPWSIPHTIYKT